jgi:hypothetical protein
MLRALPGVFVAGEMLDWEAPTGGYLLTACLATGLHAGRHGGRLALRRLRRLTGGIRSGDYMDLDGPREHIRHLPGASRPRRRSR